MSDLNLDKLYHLVKKIQYGKSCSLYCLINPFLNFDQSRSRYAQILINGDLSPSSFLQLIIRQFSYYPIFVLRWCQLIIEWIICKTFRNTPESIPSVMVDVYISKNKVLAEKHYKDSYLYNLNDYLDKAGLNYCYHGKLLLGNKNPINFLKFLFKIRSEKISIDYDFLSAIDLIQILFSGLLFPIATYSLIKYKSTKSGRKINICLLDSIDSSIIFSLVRYRSGHKIAKSGGCNYLVSWCEFKNYDRAFYFGLRQSQPPKILGCQLFVDNPAWIGTRISHQDLEFGVAPDIVLVNGTNQIAKHTHPNVILGPSLRYKSVFDVNTNPVATVSYLLLLLPQSIISTKELIRSTHNALGNLRYEIVVRHHPTLRSEEIERLLPKNWKIDQAEDLSKQILEASLIIGNISGTVLEACAMGQSALIIGSEECTNPLAEASGRGELWELAESEEKIQLYIDKLLENKKQIPKKLSAHAARIRSNFFVEPNEKNVAASIMSNLRNDEVS